MTAPTLTSVPPSVRGDGSGGRLFKTRGPLDPVNDAAIFVERPECSQLLAQARGGTVDHYLALMAPRQSGKTSVLYKIRHELLSQRDASAGVMVALVDLQGLSVEDEASAYGYVAEQLIGEWQRDARFDGAGLPKVTHGPSFRQFLLQATERQRATRLVILLDEVGAFPAKFADGFFGTIRNVFSNRHKSNEEAFGKYLFIFAGAVDLHTLTTGANSPLNICDKIFLRDLTVSGVRQLTDRLEMCNAPCPTAISEYIYAQTGGHPYLTQRICSILEQHADGPVTRGGVDAAIDEIMHGDSNLSHVTRQLDQDDEAQELTRRIIVNGERIPFSRVNPSVGRLETIGVIRPAAGGCKIRNELYLRALRTYFGVSPIRALPMLNWARRLLPLVGVLLFVLSLPTALVYVTDVMLAPPAVRHKVDLRKPGVDITVNHPTVMRDLADTSILIEMMRTVPMAALTVTVSIDDPEIILKDTTRFVVMRREDERKEFTVQLARQNYLPNLLNPFANRRMVNLLFTTPDGQTVTSPEEFHNDIVQSLGLGTVAGTLVGLLLAISQLVGYFELAKALPGRVRKLVGKERK